MSQKRRTRADEPFLVVRSLAYSVRAGHFIDRHTRRELHVTTPVVVLAAGTLESTRLLLNSGIANSSGQVGRTFMAHVATQVWGRFDAEMRMNRGYPSSLISEDMMRPGMGCVGDRSASRHASATRRAS